MLAAVALVVTGCGGAGPTPLELAGLDREYLSVESGDACLVLVLGNDGGFLVRQRERDSWDDGPMRPEPTSVATGKWAFSAGRLDLDGGGWTASYEADSTRVEIPARADTLGSLRWVTSTEGSPFSACDLVSAAEFDEFLHPAEGSGSSGG